MGQEMTTNSILSSSNSVPHFVEMENKAKRLIFLFAIWYGNKMSNEIYSDSFFERQTAGARPSAEAIISLILEIIRPRSAVDFGCGWGPWLKALQERGVDDILGIDGPYINQDKLLIPADKFLVFQGVKGLPVQRRFDLALCLEVAEHLPSEEAEDLVRILASLSDVVVFSAAIPGQGDAGIGHINEQWPEYWQELFRRCSYCLLDPFRARIFHDDRIDWWYRQNIMLAVNDKLLAQEPFNGLPEYDGRLRIIHKHVLRKYITGS